MPWQRHVADVAMEIDPVTGQLAYREIVLIVPRQSGKTTLIEALALQRAMGLGFYGGPQRITYTAQTRNKAREKWEDEFVADLERAKRMKNRFRVRKSNGSEAIRFVNGSRWGIESTTKKAGHGPTIDLGFVDEAFSQIDARAEQAMKPAMVTRASAQLWIVSTAGDESSVYLKRKLEVGRTHVELDLAEDVCYFEWSAPDDADRGAFDTWLACMPALRITAREESVRSDFRSMDPPSEFDRAYLCRWPDPLAGIEDPFGEGVWQSCRDTSSAIAPGAAMAFGVDTSPDRRWSSITVCGVRADGRRHLETIEHRPNATWLAARIVRLWRRWPGCTIVLDKRGAAASVIPDLEREGMREGIDFIVIDARELVAGCGDLFDSVISDQVRHLGQPEFDGAVSVATKRDVLDAWAWDRRSPSGVITPLVSGTFAKLGLERLVTADATPEDSFW